MGQVVAMLLAFRRIVLLGAVLFLPSVAPAQGTGRLVGRVIDADAGVPIGGARVEIVGTTLRTSTSVDGRYLFAAAPAGSHTLRVTMIGYTPKIVTAVPVVDGDVSELDVTLSSTIVELGEITVTASAERGSVSAALDEQRNSVAIVNAISAEQIARSPDGDAAAAVQRVSGATVQDGKYVFVRGLGDRYTQASLNGARIPSPEPEKKVVPLDLFPSSLLSGITTSKTFTPDQPGDFSGASVNIRTREFPGRPFLSMSASTGYNTAVTGNDFGFAPTVSGDWLALGATDRALPSGFGEIDFGTALTPTQVNSLIRSFRNVWSADSRSARPNGSFGLAMGGNLPTGGTGLNYVLSGTYSNTLEARVGEVRALAAALSGSEAEEIDRFEGNTARNSVLWGGIANFSAAIGSHTKVSLNNTYNRTMDNESRFERGEPEQLSVPIEIQRLRYVERRILSSQLALHHELGGGRVAIDWGGTLSDVSRQEPDRSEIVYTVQSGSQPAWLGFANEAAVRTFGSLDEESAQGNLDIQFNLGSPGTGVTMRFGGLYRQTDREASNRVYSISLNRTLPGDAAEMRPEDIFSTYATGENDYFRLAPLGAGGSYTAEDRLVAGYGMAVVPITASLEVVAGARAEHSTVSVASLSTLQQESLAEPEFTDVLPSLALTYRIGENVNLRLSASQTLSRPEYRELSPILFREVIAGDNVRGNPDLERTLIRNYDLRWEYYPARGEILSVALFAKQFDKPIERVYRGTSGTRIISYVNAEGANNYGVELEGRKSLGFVSEKLQSLSLFANATIMQSEIEIDPEAGAITSANRKMVGQAPYVVNAGLTWTHPTAAASATVLFNRVGERITEAGESPLPDVVERPRSVLDASVRMPLFSTLAARFDAKNLLDAEYVISQGGVTRQSYRAGRVFSVGFSWTQ